MTGKTTKRATRMTDWHGQQISNRLYRVVQNLDITNAEDVNDLLSQMQINRIPRLGHVSYIELIAALIALNVLPADYIAQQTPAMTWLTTPISRCSGPS